MSFPLWDLAKDIAVARGGKASADGTDEGDDRTMRRRIASIVWIPGAGLALVLGGWTGSWLVGLAAFIVLIAGLWLFAER